MLSSENINSDSPSSGTSSGLAAVLDVLKARTGVDFGAYRPAMVERRITNQLVASGASSIEEYLDLLSRSAAEPFRLLERIAIKVSRFYRHAPAFDYLRYEALPALACARRGEPLRIWCAGCGAGEEAYTLAMLLEDADIDAIVEATDIDSSALNEARHGIYPLSSTVELPAPLMERYLEPAVVEGTPCYRVADNLRQRVRFRYHDVTSGTAISAGMGFDLVSCRNVLIYLQRAAQSRTMLQLVEMIRDDGLLCLGEAEWLSPELLERLDPLPHRTHLFRLRSAAPFLADHELNRARMHPRP